MRKPNLPAPGAHRLGAEPLCRSVKLGKLVSGASGENSSQTTAFGDHADYHKRRFRVTGNPQFVDAARGSAHRRQRVLHLSVVVAVESRVDRTRLCTALQRYGCDCRPVADGETLEQTVASERPTAIVIDINFDGRTANRWRIAGHPLFSVAQVVVRAERTVEGLLQAVNLLRRGASGVITSIDDPHELETVLGLEAANPLASDPQTAQLTPLQRHERQLIVDALQRTNGHVIEAARLLQLGQATVYRKIQKYRIPRPQRQATSA